MKNVRLCLMVLGLAWVVSAPAGRLAATTLSAETVAVEDEAGTRERMLALRREIARHDELYFRQGAPEISDHEYDLLKAELRRLEASVVMPGEVRAEAGETPADDRTGRFATHAHAVPMLGLDKAYSSAEVAAFHARAVAKLGHEDVLYRVEPKYDGLAVSLTYEHGQLVRALTRGNGSEGEDITKNVRLIRDVRARLAGGVAASRPGRVELRGEIYLGAAGFARINAAREAAGDVAFAHPRNVAAGAVRSLDGELAGELSWVCYGWGNWEPAEAAPATMADFQALVAAWGLPRPAEARLARGVAELERAAEAMREAGARGGFPTDGVVIKVEAVAEQRALGAGAGAPRWALARKFAPERAATRLLAITWQVGRTGVLTPVAELEPVTLAGSRVTRATLHNPGEIARRDLRVGDRVWVEKAGEIIPAIVGVDMAERLDQSTAYELPENCPACAVALVRVEASNGQVAELRCESAACPARIQRRIQHYASPAAMGVTGLGPALIEALVKSGRVAGPWDLYRLDEADLAALPRVGAKSARQVIASIEASRLTARREGWRWLFGLGLPGVGAGGARRLAAAFPDIESLARADEAALVAAGLSAEVARGLEVWLRDETGRAEIAAWVSSGFGAGWGATAPDSGAEQQAVPGSEALAGEVVVVTGTLTRGSRASVTDELRAAGARVTENVGKETTLLVAGEGAAPAKTAAAQKRGVPVIDEAELARRLGDARSGRDEAGGEEAPRR